MKLKINPPNQERQISSESIKKKNQMINIKIGINFFAILEIILLLYVKSKVPSFTKQIKCR